MRSARHLGFFLASALGCSSAPGADAGGNDAGADGGAPDGGVIADAGMIADAGAEDAILGLELFGKLAGLWSGPATDTRLGDFPLKNMDLRAASDSVLFGRVDLDADNSLRFAFEVESHDGARVLVFRNGGLFLGLSRDTRTKLVETDGATYRFCAFDGGCEYVDARFRFDGETRFVLEVKVKGMLHETWTATRVETRTLPASFPARTDLSGAADFPPMPSARLTVRWSDALAAPADVWTILSTSSCVPAGDCRFSRWIKTRAEAGAREATIELDQVHAGDYVLLAAIDRNGNLEATRLPDHGDLVSIPSPSLKIGAEGTTAKDVFANFTFP